MIKKYLFFHFEKPTILCVEVDKESKKCVWVNGKRISKRQSYFTYFDTYQLAHNYIMKNLMDSLKRWQKFVNEDTEVINEFLKHNVPPSIQDVIPNEIVDGYNPIAAEKLFKQLVKEFGDSSIYDTKLIDNLSQNERTAVYKYCKENSKVKLNTGGVNPIEYLKDVIPNEIIHY